MAGVRDQGNASANMMLAASAAAGREDAVQTLRTELKKWEAAFCAYNGRAPNKDDVARNLDMGSFLFTQGSVRYLQPAICAVNCVGHDLFVAPHPLGVCAAKRYERYAALKASRATMVCS